MPIPACSRCSTPLPDGARFCPGCAAPVARLDDFAPIALPSDPRPGPLLVRRRRVLPSVVAWFAASLLGLIALPYLVLVFQFGGHAQPDPPGSSGKVFRIHEGDLRGLDAASGERMVRCQLCDGTGRTVHFAHDAGSQGLPLSEQMRHYYVDGTVACPACEGTGSVPESRLAGRLQVVPDTDATDYGHGLEPR